MEDEMTLPSHFEFGFPREALNRNWCCMALGIVGAALFMLGMITYLFF
jgi:hypothetical protein